MGSEEHEFKEGGISFLNISSTMQADCLNRNDFLAAVDQPTNRSVCRQYQLLALADALEADPLLVTT